MRPHLCTQCHYRNSTYLGRDELTASCDHPELQPEGRDLTVTEFQAPDWCPLGLVQPIKQGGLIDLPENPTVVLPVVDTLKKALAEWSVRGNMVHEDKPDPLCHTSPVLHDRACCYPCPECGFRIPSVTP
jgi:hypothetical protein